MQRVGFVITPGFQVMGLSAISVFEVANATLGRQAYQVSLLSEAGGAVPSSAGFAAHTLPFGRKQFDTVLFGAALDVQPASPALLRYVRHSVLHSRRVAAPCVGAFTLAQAGALDGRRATTHWAFARALQAQYPAVKVDEDRIFIKDGHLWTSAGMSAAVDLALALVEVDMGADVAREVAKKLVVYHRRAGGQSQFSTLLALDAKSDRIQKALAHARQNLRQPLSVEELADAANLSPRQFSRAFHAETGQTPAKAVEHLRLEAARLLLEQGRLTLDEIARDTGFADRERMRRAFLRGFGQSPQALRRVARLVG